MKEFEKYEITVFFKDEEIPIVVDVPSFIIGRSINAEVSLLYDLVSREHLKISLKGENVFIEELGSSNGTWLNGNKLKIKSEYLYENDSRLIVGNIKGPLILIKCLFKQEEKVKQIEEKNSILNFDINKDVNSKDNSEEITQVNNNTIFDQLANNDNIVILNPDLGLENEFIKSPIAKVVNGNYEYREKNRPISQISLITPKYDEPVKAIVEPELFLQMKNILSLEVQKASQKSQKQAEDIKAVSLKEAERIINEANKEALLIRQKTQEESRNIELKNNSEFEKNKLIATNKIELLFVDANKEADYIKKNAFLEVEVIRESIKNESEEIIEVATIRAKELTFNSRKTSEELIQKARKKVDEINLSATNESSELMLLTSNESAAVRLSAQVFSEEIISKAHDKATKYLQDTDYIIKFKLEEFQRVEDENKKNIQKLNDVLQDLKIKTETLKDLEFESRNNYNNLTKGFEKEQVRINIERTSIDELRIDLLTVKNEIEKKITDLKFEEKNVRLQSETIVLEQKIQISQAVAEVQQAQIIKDNLSLEISFLKNEKERADRGLKEVELDLLQRNQKIEMLYNDEKLAVIELTKVRALKEETLLEIENGKRELAIANEKIIFDESKVSEKIKSLEAYSIAADEKIKQDILNFEIKKKEMTVEFQNDKSKQLRALEDELEKNKKLFNLEMSNMTIAKTQTLLEYENQEKKSLLAIEQKIKKNNQETQVIQKVHKDEVEKQRLNTQERMMQMKNKYNDLSSQLQKKHDDEIKFLNNDVVRLTNSKKNAEKELRLIESSRQEKITKIDQEVRDSQIEARNKIDMISRKVNEETLELKESLSKIKEKSILEIDEFKKRELEELRVLKDNSIKDIHGRKSEKAKAVTTDVETIILTQLNNFRNQKINDIFIESCSKEISSIVYNTLMNHHEDNRGKLDLALKTKLDVRKRSMLMTKAFYWIIFLVVIIAFIVFYPQVKSLPEFSDFKIFIDKIF